MSTYTTAKKPGLAFASSNDNKVAAEFSRKWALASRTTAEHQVAEFLREKIIVGEIARGEKLKQAEIAQMLDISITPVREALRILEAQGYVQVSAHKGAVVAPFLIEHVEEHFELRLMLEPRLTFKAASRMTAGDLAELKALNDQMVKPSAKATPHVLQEANFRFHFRLYEVADQPQTLDFVRILWAKYPFDLLTVMPGRSRRVGNEHKQLLAALGNRDAKGAMQAMATHIKVGWNEFLEAYPAAGDNGG